MVDETPTIGGSQTVDESPLKTTETTQEADVMNDKSGHVTITEKKVENLRVSKRKRIVHEKLRN